MIEKNIHVAGNANLLDVINNPSEIDVESHEIRLTGTGKTSLDGELLQIRDYDTNLKCNFAFPSEIASSTTLST